MYYGKIVMRKQRLGNYTKSKKAGNIYYRMEQYCVS